MTSSLREGYGALLRVIVFVCLKGVVNWHIEDFLQEKTLAFKLFGEIWFLMPPDVLKDEMLMC